MHKKASFSGIKQEAHRCVSGGSDRKHRSKTRVKKKER